MISSNKLALLADCGYKIASEHNIDKLINLLAQKIDPQVVEAFMKCLPKMHEFLNKTNA